MLFAELSLGETPIQISHLLFKGVTEYEQIKVPNAFDKIF